jgi:peroxin-5
MKRACPSWACINSVSNVAYQIHNLITILEEQNSHLKDGNGSLQAAKDLLEAGGSLSEVALMLEAAIQQKDMGEGGYEAWVLLGEVRSMDEREELGMLALREGVRIASEQGGAGGVGMLVSRASTQYVELHLTTLLPVPRNLIHQ